MTNLTGKDIQLSKEVEIARMFIAKEKPNKKDSIGNLLKIAEEKGYYFSEDSLKIALK